MEEQLSEDLEAKKQKYQTREWVLKKIKDRFPHESETEIRKIFGLSKYNGERFELAFLK